MLKDRLRAALLRLNDGLTGAQSERVIFDLERADGIGMARNRLVHECLTYGLSLTVDGPDGRDTRTVRFFDFDDPVGGQNEFVVTTQFRVLRGNEKGDLNDDRRVVIPDLALFVNGIPPVVMEARSPSLMGAGKTQAVRQLRHYQEAEPHRAAFRPAHRRLHHPPIGGRQGDGGDSLRGPAARPGHPGGGHVGQTVRHAAQLDFTHFGAL